MLEIETLHHVTLPVADLDRSKRFYAEVLGLREIARPPLGFPGCWFQLGDRQLHLIERDDGSVRAGRGVDSRDIHFAVRVSSFQRAVATLRAHGYREDLDVRDPLKMKVSAGPKAGFPQIFIMDPDRHVIEINAAGLDG